jgi:Protein of unknown function (DUF2865)
VGTRGGKSLRDRAKAIVTIALTGIVAMTFVLAAGSASAQNGIFDTILDLRPAPVAPPASSPATAYADPFSAWNPFGSRAAPPAAPLEMGTSAAYCVRLCDGRFFPIQRHDGVTPEQSCSSFCPASRTKIYDGSSIEQAVAPDGKRYADLGTAFLYREKIVPGCTCNGKDAFGLVNIPLKQDPTLRAGDIVATNRGMMVYNGGTRRQSFSPVASYPGLSAELRRKLTRTKTTPAAETAALAAVKQGDNAAAARKNKRVQLDR